MKRFPDYLLFIALVCFAPNAFAASASNAWLKCTVSISATNIEKLDACGSEKISQQCHSESPGEPAECFSEGRVVVKNGRISLAASIANDTLLTTVDSGDGNSIITKVRQDAIQFPFQFSSMVPERDANQRVTNLYAYITCSLYSDGDSQKECNR